MLKVTLSAKEEFVSRHNVCGETENLREERREGGREGGREGEDTDVRKRVAATPQMSLILVLHNTPVVAMLHRPSLQSVSVHREHLLHPTVMSLIPHNDSGSTIHRVHRYTLLRYCDSDHPPPFNSDAHQYHSEICDSALTSTSWAGQHEEA